MTYLLTALSTITSFLVAAALPTVHDTVLDTRNCGFIKDVSASTRPWKHACINAGGGSRCVSLSDNAASSLCSNSDACEQLQSADAMVDLAKQLGNDPTMIEYSQIFVQQPRNPLLPGWSTPYCQESPRNVELQGLFPCQYASADEEMFVGGIAVGWPGTIPYGMSAPVDPPGSCPANPDGPIADGSLLLDVTKSKDDTEENQASDRGEYNTTESRPTSPSGQSPHWEEWGHNSILVILGIVVGAWIRIGCPGVPAAVTQIIASVYNFVSSTTKVVDDAEGTQNNSSPSVPVTRTTSRSSGISLDILSLHDNAADDDSDSASSPAPTQAQERKRRKRKAKKQKRRTHH